MSSIAFSVISNPAGLYRSMDITAKKFSNNMMSGGFLDSGLEDGTINETSKNINIQNSAYGDIVPMTFGTNHLAGNIIWGDKIRKIEQINTDGGSKGSPATSSKTVSYYTHLAIAICEGKIAEISRIWADMEELSLSTINYRIYYGDEHQMPDSLMEAIMGVGDVPAYRGLAYIVFEDLNITSFGGRIPNFLFEVSTKTQSLSEDSAEQLLEAINVIPGSGEFVYDTICHYKIDGKFLEGKFIATGSRKSINQNNNSAKTDFSLAMDQMSNALPNLKWIGLVVGWYGDSMDIANCNILPCIETQNILTEPYQWQVGNFTRQNARLISMDNHGNPNYGGTVSDESLIRSLQDLKNRGYKILLYPFLFMDVPSKPWRGRLTGNPADIENFFTKENGYNNFILHYTNLTKDLIDGILIGSEMIGLTSIKSGNNFPAVDKFSQLATQVKNIVGQSVLVSYAADWSEYHHTNGGWFNLDELWANPSIDFVGIDAYFPLTNEIQDKITEEMIMDGWESGEEYDYYYEDQARTIKKPLSADFAWKNIRHWWENCHTNPDSTQTPWLPKMKQIWLTEYGFPSLDAASNQPNVFFDPNSSESAIPRLSTKTIDFAAQKMAISATEKKWKNSDMIRNKFLWCYDARPYPFFPKSWVWADAPNWLTGHWINGKMQIPALKEILTKICVECGFDVGDIIFIGNFNQIIDGFVVSSSISSKQIITQLQIAYNFITFENNGKVIFRMVNDEIAFQITEDDLIIQNGKIMEIAEDDSQKSRIDITYIDKNLNYNINSESVQNPFCDVKNTQKISLPIVTTKNHAKQIANFHLYQKNIYYKFFIPFHENLQIGDNIKIGEQNPVNIRQISMFSKNVIEIVGYGSHNSNIKKDFEIESVNNIQNSGAGSVKIFEIPSDGDNLELSFAFFPIESGYKESSLFYSFEQNGEYKKLFDSSNVALAGIVLSNPSQDEFIVEFNKYTNRTATIPNIAKIGDEIVKFDNIQIQSENIYKIFDLKRGLYNTENAVTTSKIGADFIILDENITKYKFDNSLLNSKIYFKNISHNHIDEIEYTISSQSIKPFSPVHLRASLQKNGNILIEFTRQTRKYYKWQDYIDSPSESERFLIEFFNGDNVVSSYQISEQRFLYNTQMQIQDFGTLVNPMTLQFRACQLSNLVGLGNFGYYIC